MIRNFMLLAGWVLAFGLSINTASADTFTATYRELALSPANFATTWYSGAVTRDGKFVYGLGNSHNAYGNNSLWAYDPATNTHTNLFANTGNKWVWTAGVDQSGHWSDPNIRALTNRNNHQAFYVAARNEFWVLAGTTFYQSSPYFGGRFSLDTNRWEYLSPPWGQKTQGDLADFSAGLIAGPAGWVAANAVTATCPDIGTVVLFGGMSSTAGMRMIEPNPAGPEPYQWSTAPKPPFHHPVENARHNAACVGDTVYFVEGQRRVAGTPCCTTPDPAQAWKFHVPTRTWTRLPDGPPGGYFGVLTYDADANALLLYGGGPGGTGSTKLWVYDLAGNAWHNLTGTIANLPRVDMQTGGYIPGFGHVYKGGRRFRADGSSYGYAASAMVMKIALTRVAPPPPEPVVGNDPPPDEQQTPESSTGGTQITWTKIPLAVRGVSPVGSMKHQRLAEGPAGRVYILGGDFGGDGGNNTGRQEVFSFDPLSATGDWRLEAPYCGTTANPVHWHTDEAGVAWDAKRKLFWKLSGTEYGPDDACLAEGRSVKAKVITFDPSTGLWAVPPHVAQTRFGYVANGVLDPVKDQMVQIIDKSAKHLDLITGQWATYPLPGDALRFNAIVARSGRTLWWLNRSEVLESYDLDTHVTTSHGVWPFGAQSGWATAMTMIHQGKVLSIWPTSLSTEAKRAALYDPATKQWTKLDMGAGRGNTAMMHSSGKVILMGGMAPPEDHNKFVWVGTLG